MHDQLWHLACDIRTLRQFARNAATPDWSISLTALADDLENILTDLTTLPGALDGEVEWHASEPR